MFCDLTVGRHVSMWYSKCVRTCTGGSGVCLCARFQQDLVNWYCSLLTRRTVCGRVARTIQTAKNKWIETRHGKHSVVVLQDHYSYEAPWKHYLQQKLRNVNVRPNPFNYFMWAFDILIRHKLYGVFQRYATSSNFLIRSLLSSDTFSKSQNFPPMVQHFCKMVTPCIIYCSLL